jgi:hypothetical protein
MRGHALLYGPYNKHPPELNGKKSRVAVQPILARLLGSWRLPLELEPAGLRRSN